ncbi:GTPase [Aureobasidium pullulans]|nr:GTPase [Aureobasidium pullulans]THY31003.1 GTPase [Aureobasidium pullulans]THZ05056.1 GTPase [Aureobasidium pullulans]
MGRLSLFSATSWQARSKLLRKHFWTLGKQQKVSKPPKERTTQMATMVSIFKARAVFPPVESLPRSYFLGHHAAGLSKMNTLLSQIDLIVECRDYRVPLTSRNPLFEQSLAGRERIIIYTKRDLGSNNKPADKERENIIRKWHKPSEVLFSDHKDKKDIRKVLAFARRYFENSTSLTGSRIMVVGMPNVGKSSLLNALRKEGVGKGKAAHTGAQPGVTRKISTSVKIIDSTEDGEGVYLLDTPGVFIPYVPDAEAMLKLALCGNVKDTIIPPATLADYLLYRVNLIDPTLYKEYCPPTNDIIELLNAIAHKTGRLQKGGEPDTEAVALWMIQRWRNGLWGRFLLDEVSEGGLQKRIFEESSMGGSMNQARRADKEARKLRNIRRHAGTSD